MKCCRGDALASIFKRFHINITGNPLPKVIAAITLMTRHSSGRTKDAAVSKGRRGRACVEPTIRTAAIHWIVLNFCFSVRFNHEWRNGMPRGGYLSRVFLFPWRSCDGWHNVALLEETYAQPQLWQLAVMGANPTVLLT